MRRLLISLAALALLAFGLAASVAWLFPPPSQAQRLVLTVADTPGGLDPVEQEGLRVFLKSLLESAGSLAVVDAPAVLQEGDPQALQLKVAGRRTADQLALEIQIRDSRGRQSKQTLGPSAPRDVLKALFYKLHLPVECLDARVPYLPEHTIHLFQTLGAESIAQLQASLSRLRNATHQEPGCSALWAATGITGHYLLLRAALPEGYDPKHVESAFQRALQVAPLDPWTAGNYAAFMVDCGNAQGALDLLAEVQAAHPKSLIVLAARRYAARNAGLLEGALRVKAMQDQLAGPLRFVSGMVENTWLYTGQWQLFEDTLGHPEQPDRSPLRDFYRGYIRLMRGRTQEALPFFQRAGNLHEGTTRFSRLSQVFHLHLTGRGEEARTQLQSLWAEHRSARVGDGEFTFKLAEAFAIMGSKVEAVDAAERAFHLGFSCARWYQESPFLTELQNIPRMKALIQHVQERQSALAARFPLSRFSS